jgi:hypothetical protein
MRCRTTFRGKLCYNIATFSLQNRPDHVCCTQCAKMWSTLGQIMIPLPDSTPIDCESITLAQAQQALACNDWRTIDLYRNQQNCRR